jgi:putative effector of murein hydrolase
MNSRHIKRFYINQCLSISVLYLLILTTPQPTYYKEIYEIEALNFSIFLKPYTTILAFAFFTAVKILKPDRITDMTHRINAI